MGQNQSQLLAKMGMSFKNTANAKNDEPIMDQNKSQLWAEMRTNYDSKRPRF